MWEEAGAGGEAKISRPALESTSTLHWQLCAVRRWLVIERENTAYVNRKAGLPSYQSLRVHRWSDAKHVNMWILFSGPAVIEIYS